MASQLGQQTFNNIVNQTMKTDQLTEYNKRNIFLQKSIKK